MENWLSIGDNAGGAVADPVAPWMFQTPAYLAWAACAIWFCIDLRRRRELSVAALLFLGATSMFWQEFYADWGARLVYTPAFSLMPWESPYTTPNKPWFMPAAYGVYFLIIFMLQVAVVRKLRGARRSLILPVLIVAVPFFYLWDFIVEGTAVAMGWWTYVNPLPPVMHTAHGLMPLAHPLGVFTMYGVVMTWLLAHRDDTGKPVFERIAGTARMPLGVARELRRLLLWVVVMNAVYLLFLTGPCMAVRILAGDA